MALGNGQREKQGLCRFLVNGKMVALFFLSFLFRNAQVAAGAERREQEALKREEDARSGVSSAGEIDLLLGPSSALLLLFFLGAG